MTEETVKVLYNVSYGGFALSEETIKLYNERSTELKIVSRYEEVSRTDPILVQIYEEIGYNRFGSGLGACFDIQEIPKKYENYYKINEYDGYEEVSIDYNAYKVDTSMKIINDTAKTAEEKIAELAAILNQ
jgi:hypothetical protein